MTIGTGPRGAAARAFAGRAARGQRRGQASPCSALLALNRSPRPTARSSRAYQRRFGELPGLSGGFVAATDTFARGVDAARSRTWPTATASTWSARTRRRASASRPRRRIETFADPDAHATSPSWPPVAQVYNEAFLWGPKDVRRAGRDAAAQRRGVQPQGAADAARGGARARRPVRRAAPRAANLRPYRIPGPARLGFATSLPAFSLRRSARRASTRVRRRHLLHALPRRARRQRRNPGRRQPGRLDRPDGDIIQLWQPLSWMTSTWRAVADPTRLFDYNVTPMLDRQPRRPRLRRPDRDHPAGRATGRGCHYVGNAQCGSPAGTGPTS